MSDTHVAELTPPGTGAIATVEIAGPCAWDVARRLFRPHGKQPLPDTPELYSFWLGTFGPGVGDEVILAVTAFEPELRIEIHCHGGRRIVEWVKALIAQEAKLAESLTSERFKLGTGNSAPGTEHLSSEFLLTRAPTLRTASILLDQAHGALAAAVRRVLDILECDPLASLEALREITAYERVGRHLIEPWKVVVAGPPNVGKSSLVNALAGYQRTVVSPVAGTTRDAVSVTLAFDGWPVDLIDTAGLREAEGLEAEGIARARRELEHADLIVWVLDPEHPKLEFDEVPTEAIIPVSVAIVVMNKCDLTIGVPSNAGEGVHPVSAHTGDGISAFIAKIVDRLVENDPPPGAAVPFTSALAERLLDAQRALVQGRPREAKVVLSEVLAGFTG